MTGRMIVFVTAPDAAVAEKIASAVVEEKLAACANLLPGLLSIYAWRGKVNRDREILVLMKTKASLFTKLEARIKSMHPYEVPEIVGLEIAAGHAPYLDWIDDSTLEA